MYQEITSSVLFWRCYGPKRDILDYWGTAFLTLKGVTLRQVTLTEIYFDVGVIHGRIATSKAPLFSSYTVELESKFIFLLSFPNLSMTSLIILFKGVNALTY